MDVAALNRKASNWYWQPFTQHSEKGCATSPSFCSKANTTIRNTALLFFYVPNIAIMLGGQDGKAGRLQQQQYIKGCCTFFLAMPTHVNGYGLMTSFIIAGIYSDSHCE
jgi:hypothetical protein